MNEIPQLDGTGGFLLLRRDSKKKPGFDLTVRIFVANVDDGVPFAWHAPSKKSEEWFLIDVPFGFSINNGEVLAEAFEPGPEQPDPPVIVHGRP